MYQNGKVDQNKKVEGAWKCEESSEKEIEKIHRDQRLETEQLEKKQMDGEL